MRETTTKTWFLLEIESLGANVCPSIDQDRFSEYHSQTITDLIRSMCGYLGIGSLGPQHKRRRMTRSSAVSVTWWQEEGVSSHRAGPSCDAGARADDENDSDESDDDDEKSWQESQSQQTVTSEKSSDSE